jgi:Flp pilus assembly protein TadG
MTALIVTIFISVAFAVVAFGDLFAFKDVTHHVEETQRNLAHHQAPKSPTSTEGADDRDYNDLV